MDMIGLNLGPGDVKVCTDDLIDGKDIMETQALIVEEDASLGSVDDQNITDMSNTDTLLDATAEDDVDLQPYQFRPNEGVTYRVVQVSSASLPDNESTSLSQIITAPSLATAPQTLSTVFTSPLNGQLYVIGTADDVYSRTNNHKPIAPRTSSVVENIRNPGISKRDDRRRATHNEVERRRRDKINNWIMKLSKIVPDCHTDTSKGYDVQQSKGGILAKACDYILELSESNQRLMGVLKENEKLGLELGKQKTENERLLRENADLRNLLKQNGINVIGRYQKK